MCPCTAATPHTTHHSKESPKKTSLETTLSETNKALYWVNFELKLEKFRMNNWPFVWLQAKRKIRVCMCEWENGLYDVVWKSVVGEEDCRRARLGELTSGWRLGEKQSHWSWHEFWQAPKPNFWWSLGLVVRRHGYFWHRLELKVVELTQWQGLARFHHWSRTGESGKHRMQHLAEHWFCWYTLCRCHGSPPRTTYLLPKPEAKKKRLIMKTFKRDFDP